MMVILCTHYWMFMTTLCVLENIKRSFWPSLRWPSIPNFSGPSRILRACPEINTRSFGMLNCPEFRTLSRICPDLTSRCVKQLIKMQLIIFTFFCRSEMRSVKIKRHQIHFRLGLRPGPRMGSLRCSARLPSPYISSLMSSGIMS